MTEQGTDEAAWVEQEAFLRADPDGVFLARALAQPLEPVPQGFAAAMARLAARPRETDDRTEALLQYGLLGLLAVIGLALGQRFLEEWWAALPDASDPGMPGWLALILVCLALSAAPGFSGARLR